MKILKIALDLEIQYMWLSACLVCTLPRLSPQIHMASQALQCVALVFPGTTGMALALHGLSNITVLGPPSSQLRILKSGPWKPQALLGSILPTKNVKIVYL